MQTVTGNNSELAKQLPAHLKTQLQHCVLPAAARRCLPTALYTDDKLLELEAEAILRAGWIGIGRADRFARNGAFEAIDIAGRSVIVLRDGDGSLRCFANSCRHRGARLLDGSGHCRLIRCPFHSWSYRLDGTLIGAPEMPLGNGFDATDHGLVEYPADTLLGFAFISFNPRVASLQQQLGNFAAVHQHWPLQSLVSTRRRSFEVDCNWKAFLEVFNEYYHLPFVHADSIGDVYQQPMAADSGNGAYTSQFGTTTRSGGILQHSEAAPLAAMPGLDDSVRNGVRYTWIYPNMTFALGADALWLYEASPLGASRCLVHQTACFSPDTINQADFEHRVTAYYQRLDVAIEEDIPALENQHRGLQSGATRQGPFQPLLEANVVAHTHWYASQLLATDGHAGFS